jgi:CHAD domain-containing protein
MAADRAPIGLGKAIARWASRPPSRRRKAAHRPILAPAPRPLAALALGVGIGAAALLAARELRRAVAPAEDPLPDPASSPHKLALHDGETAAIGVRRMTMAQLDLAIQTLMQATGPDLEEAVHETRKAIKRVRTLERLMADASERARREHRRDLLREAAGELSGARDAQVALNTLEGLVRRAPKQLNGSSGVARLHAALLVEHSAAERAVHESGARERALRLLQDARADLAAEPARGGRREARALTAGMIRIYTRGRVAMRAARRRRRIAEMHEWRKRVKDLRHAAEALSDSAVGGAGTGTGAAKRGSRRARLRKVGREADRLGEALGEEHDLALLAQRVGAEDAIFRGDKAGRKRLQRAIRRRRKRLRDRAFEDGATLYRAGPGRFRKRLPKALVR